MLRLLRRGAAVLLTCVVTAATGAVPAGAETSSPGDVLTLLGEDRWFAGYGAAAHPLIGPFPTNGGVQVATGGVDSVLASGSGPDPARLVVTAQPGSPRLSVGPREANRHDSDTDVHVTVGLPGKGCDAGFSGPSPSSVEVLGLSRDAAGRLTGLALDYSVVCHPGNPPVRGSLRWNSDVPYTLTTATSFRAPGSGAGVTARGSLVLTNTGTVPQTFGPSTWQPDTVVMSPQSPVVVERDGCAGVTVPPGSSCSVHVSAASDGVHGADGYLRTPDGTLRGAAYSRVSMTAVPTPPKPGLHATSERGAVHLSALPYHPAYRVLRAAPGGPEVEIARDVAMPWSDTTGIGGVSYTYRIVPVAGGADGPASDPTTIGALPRAVGEDGTFVTVEPARLLDTRYGIGVRQGPVGPGETVHLDPSAAGHLPATGVSAVLLNVTGTEASAPTHVRVWPAGAARPDTSSVNLTQHQSRPNQVVVPLGANGEIALYNNTGSTHLVVDLQGFYSAVDGPHGGGYHAAVQHRVLDTRTSEGPLEAAEEIWIPIGSSDADASRMAAVEVNLTVTQPTAHGHLTAWDGVTEAPAVSNANFAPGQTVANHAVVPVSLDPAGRPGIVVRNSAGSTHLVVDVLGWYDGDAQPDGLRYRATPTHRIADTRTRTPRRAVEPRQWTSVRADELPTAVAHVINVTATEGVGPGHLTVWDGMSFTGDPPSASSVNFARGEDSPNLATVASSVHVFGRAGIDLGFGFRGTAVSVSAASASVHVVVDHLGYFY